MKNSIFTENEVIATKLREESSDNASYAMYSVGIRDTQRYIIYAGNGEEGEFGVLRGDTDDADTLFECICRCSLSPEHLFDVISDHNHYPKR